MTEKYRVVRIRSGDLWQYQGKPILYPRIKGLKFREAMDEADSINSKESVWIDNRLGGLPVFAIVEVDE
jgi:hypothetical protein